MIVQMGGFVSRTPNKITHYLMKNENRKDFNQSKHNDSNIHLKHFVNIKFIFHSFFYLKLMDESDEQYSTIDE